MNLNKSKNIKAIDKIAVHRICSGQVVLNLAIAVKELIENSLDAGATVIDIRLREYGSELIEVTDNGSGVEPTNFQGLTLKHHTSKLQDFSDLVTVETFGFRGEALSSLCSLSDLTITTRRQSSDCGSKLQYDHNGIITSCTSVARQVGTTVCLENIFSTLPVRQKEFHRNLKREFGKMTQLLYAYCLVSTGVKITCTNHTKKGGKITVLATQGCKTIRENIACVFGTKQLTSLLEMKTVPPNEEALECFNLKNVDINVEEIFQLEGFISSCAHGLGRSTNDRQFYYVNSRPCEPTKVVKAVNEVFHQYNLHQQPFVFLNICSSRDSVDVNVTPDKRQVFMEHEKLLVATVKASLQALYENIPSTYTVNNSISSAKNLPSPTKSALSQISPASTLSQFRHASAVKRGSIEQPTQKLPKQAKLDSIFMKNEKPLALLNGFSKGSNIGLNQAETLRIFGSELQEELGNNIIQDGGKNVVDKKTANNSGYGMDSELSWERHNEDRLKSSNDKNVSGEIRSDNMNSEIVIFENKDISEKISCSQFSAKSDTNLTTISEHSVCDSSNSQFSATSNISDFTPPPTVTNTVENISCEMTENEVENGISEPCSSLLVNQSCDLQTDQQESCIIQHDEETLINSEHRRSIEVSLTMDKLKEHFQRSCEIEKASEEKRVRFRAVIDPSKNKQAEQELSREISKDKFAKMEVIGQFNLGFIIARLDSDLFIVDQHATDEKYNFETLQRTTTISSQKLVVPQQLELTALNESVLIDNIEVFKANGFEFQIDEESPTTTKVKLTSIPMSRNWTFGKEDIDELLFMLQDAPGTLCRPSRVRAMFASRACRKSVMIGSALSRGEMKRLLTHMGEIEQPWNCPHGRPTMRHLINLDFV